MNDDPVTLVVYQLEYYEPLDVTSMFDRYSAYQVEQFMESEEGQWLKEHSLQPLWQVTMPSMSVMYGYKLVQVFAKLDPKAVVYYTLRYS